MLDNELLKAINNGTVSHAYLFTSESAASEFSHALGARSVDYIQLEARENRIHILTEDIERLQEELKYKPYGERRVVYIKAADSMLVQAQNKLLKTLEEPPLDTVIILYAKRRDSLLPTVLSRCVEIACPEESIKSNSAEKLALEFYEKKRAGAQFFELKAILEPILEDKGDSRVKALEFLDAFEDLLRTELINTLDPDKTSGAIKLTEEARRNTESGFSTEYALKALALNI